MTPNIVKEPIVQARWLESKRKNETFGSASVVDISIVQGAIFAPSNGRILLHAGERAPPTGDHWYGTVVREA